MAKRWHGSAGRGEIENLTLTERMGVVVVVGAEGKGDETASLMSA